MFTTVNDSLMRSVCIWCGGLNEDASDRLIYLTVPNWWNCLRSIRWFGLVGGGLLLGGRL